MNYPGGKGKVGRMVAEVMLAERGQRQTYIEPFLGAASVFCHIAPHFPRAIGTDASPDMALLWQALMSGWEPPTFVSEAEYQALRHAPTSALRTFVGFGCSFGAKWFGGYARGVDAGKGERNFADTARRGLAKKLATMGDAVIGHADYRQLDALMGPDVVVYCDPPYARTTTAYANGGQAFNSDEFWWTVSLWARAGAQVFVSEEEAPAWSGAREVWSRKQALTMAGGAQRDGRTERLFLVG